MTIVKEHCAVQGSKVCAVCYHLLSLHASLLLKYLLKVLEQLSLLPANLSLFQDCPKCPLLKVKYSKQINIMTRELEALRCKIDTLEEENRRLVGANNSLTTALTTLTGSIAKNVEKLQGGYECALMQCTASLYHSKFAFHLSSSLCMPVRYIF